MDWPSQPQGGEEARARREGLAGAFSPIMESMRISNRTWKALGQIDSGLGSVWTWVLQATACILIVWEQRRGSDDDLEMVITITQNARNVS